MLYMFDFIEQCWLNEFSVFLIHLIYSPSVSQSLLDFFRDITDPVYVCSYGGGPGTDVSGLYGASRHFLQRKKGDVTSFVNI